MSTHIGGDVMKIKEKETRKTTRRNFCKNFCQILQELYQKYNEILDSPYRK